MKIGYKILLFLIIGFQISCNKSETKVKSVAKSNVRLSKEAKVETAESKIDNYSYPVDSLLKANILWTGLFHGDEVDSNLQKKIWYGLFKSGNNYLFSKTAISINHAFDPVLDEDETEQTGWEVSTEIKDTCVILVEKMPDFADRNVEFVKLPKNVYPGENYEFQFLGTQYKLFATGKKKKEHPDSDWLVVSDYKLYLTASRNGKVMTELLTAKKNFDDQMVSVVFAGDLDGDGKLDLILDTANHYNVSSLTLYLSKSADKNKIIKPVGVLIFVGC
ncbi:VCBS repeat-containing protein [Flavobacterium zhairuonense]|uniref:VCBS repeat-containing protein n=1 Tax=Flavobacterium zhairuonense TaxID=2493631 RepID=UPI00104D3C04|nr:VCBS repeat-containing protein [Flavobacterium zhairuonense]KAF2510893.1 VCBS repeat-containing protein [Flavobacterium zhairuonense]